MAKSAEQTAETYYGEPVIGPTHPRQQCEQLWQQYATAWTAIPATACQQLIEQCLHPSVQYVDKQARVVGWAEVTRRIELFRTKVAGASFRVSALTLHHEYGRGEWAGVDSEGKVWLEGVDFIEFAEDGRICKLVGFY